MENHRVGKIDFVSRIHWKLQVISALAEQDIKSVDSNRAEDLLRNYQRPRRICGLYYCCEYWETKVD